MSTNIPTFLMHGRIKDLAEGAAKFFFEISYNFKIILSNLSTREDKGDRESIPHTHPIPQVIRLELFLTPQISRGIRQQPIT